MSFIRNTPMAAALLSGGAPFNPLSLFASGAAGGWWDPSDITTVFQDLVGTAGAVDSSVGLILDKSKNLAATPLTVGAWTMSVAGGTSTAVESPAGTLTLQNDGTNAAQADQSFTTVAGTWYKIVFNVATAGIALRVGTTQGGTDVLASTTYSTGSALVGWFQATSSTSWVRFIRSSSGTSVVSAISLAAVAGNHASQATSSKRPVLKSSGGLFWLQFDGVDDSLAVPVAAASGTVGLTIAAGNRKTGTSAAFTGPLCARNSSASISPIRFGLIDLSGSGTNQGMDVRNAGDSASADSTGQTWTLSADFVSVGRFIPGSKCEVRMNGTAASAATALTTRINDATNVKMAALPAVSGAGEATFANMRIYQLLVIARDLTDAEVAKLETWMKPRVGVSF